MTLPQNTNLRIIEMELLWLIGVKSQALSPSLSPESPQGTSLWTPGLQRAHLKTTPLWSLLALKGSSSHPRYQRKQTKPFYRLESGAQTSSNLQGLGRKPASFKPHWVWGRGGTDCRLRGRKSSPDTGSLVGGIALCKGGGPKAQRRQQLA